MLQLRRFFRNLDATTIVLVITLGIFIAARICMVLLGGQLPVFIIFGADYSPFIAEGQVWRWLTAGFLHTDPIHFFLNAYALWVLGRFVERYYSQRKFIMVLVLGIIAGNALSFALDLIQVLNGVAYTPVFSLGISGGVFALLGLLLGTSLRTRRYGQDLPIDRNQLLLIAGYNLLLGFLLPNINNAAHIGGLIAGGTLSFLIEPYYMNDRIGWRAKVLKIFTVLIAIAIFSAIILQAITAIFFFS